MKKLTIIAACLLAIGKTAAASERVPAMPSPIAVSAPQGASIPLREGPAGSEQWEQFFGQLTVRNVTHAALYPVLPPSGQGNGKAVIVIPGGAYQFVSMESEGFRVAERLAAAGYTAFVLKYRTKPNDRDPAHFAAAMALGYRSLGTQRLPDDPDAIDDLAATIRLVRSRASEWQIDARQIGAIGFSAGGDMLVRLIERKPEAVQLHEVALLYPPMFKVGGVDPRPPLFLAAAGDDPLFRQAGLSLVEGWLKQDKRVEFHLYANGGHGFGMRAQGTTSDGWFDQYLTWLKAQ